MPKVVRKKAVKKTPKKAKPGKTKLKRNPRSNLTAAVVRRIKKRFARGHSVPRIIEDLNLDNHPQTLYMIKRGTTWSHVEI